jgi:hypothetical protein
MDSKMRTGSVGGWVARYRRWLVFWLAAMVVLAIVVSVAWPETETAGALVVMSGAAITGLVLCALWTEELLRALRTRDGVALFFVLFEIGKIVIVLGGSLLFLFAVWFTLSQGL